jgi:transposase
MRKTSFYTIKPLDYTTIEKNLRESNLSADAIQAMKILLDDHRTLTKTQKRITEEQTAQATSFFKLFEDPIVEEKGIQIPIELEDENTHESEDSSSQKEKKSRKIIKRTKFSDKVVLHNLSDENKKCPSCGDKMHMQRSKTKTYILALPMLTTETHISESCRCLSCDTQNTAEHHDNLEKESIGNFHFSAISSLATLRYQCGMASYRLENMSDAFGVKIPDSTQWFLFESAAPIIQPFLEFLEKEVANSPVQHTDDTHNTVLSITKKIEQEQQLAFLKGKNPDTVRSGIHTTNITGVFPEGQLVLFKTGLHHSGEILAKILSQRTIEEQLIIMADAASANTSKINFKDNDHVKMANCNSHVVRKFKDLASEEEQIAQDNFIRDFKISEPLNFFLFRYKIIFENEQKTRKMTAAERLVFHKTHSFPLMNEMQNRAKNILANKMFEPNSKIAKTFQYFLNHYEKFIAFCILENAPVCNNLSERMLKCIIRHRRNSLFFKTQIGANVADIFTSILFTAKANNINSTHYLRDLFLYQALWKKNPHQWLPWNYLATIEKIKNSNI